MEMYKIALGIFLIVFWLVWFLISRKRKAQEKRYHEFIEERKTRKLIDAIRKQSLKKNWEHYGRNVLYNEKTQNKHYNLPLNDIEERLTANSVVSEFQIRDWQFFLQRKLTCRELMILELTSTHGLPIEQNHFI